MDTGPGHTPRMVTGHTPLRVTGPGHTPLRVTGHTPLRVTGHTPLRVTGHTPLRVTGHSPLRVTGHTPLRVTEQGSGGRGLGGQQLWCTRQVRSAGFRVTNVSHTLSPPRQRGFRPGRGLRSPAADSRKIAKVRGRLSRKIASPAAGSAARPSTGLQTGLHTTGLDIMSYDIQIFHVLVTPGTSSTTPDTPSKRRVPGSRRGMRRARQRPTLQPAALCAQSQSLLQDHRTGTRSPQDPGPRPDYSAGTGHQPPRTPDGPRPDYRRPSSWIHQCNLLRYLRRSRGFDAMVKCSAWRLLLLQSVLTAGVLSQGDFSLEDALDPDVPPTARGRTTKAPPSLLPTNPKRPAPPPRPATPRPGNDFDLADALLPSNDKPEKPNRKNQGGGISDDDLFGLVKDEDYKPDKGKGNQPSDGKKGQTDLTGSGAEVGTIGGIVSAVAMALVGAVTSYISYQKKKLCFGIQQSLNVDVMKSEAPDAVVATEPQVQQSLMETKAERPPSEDNTV
ncbi:unnamed protein product [Boreogadus saida]